MLARFFFTVLPLCWGCRFASVSASETKIVNEEVGGLVGQFPEVFQLRSFGNRQMVLFSGTFISPRMILTVAHGLVDPDTLKPFDRIVLKLPTGDISPKHSIAWSKFNGQLSEGKSYDLGLLVFDKDITNNYAKIAPNKSIKVGDEIVLVGFGSTSFHRMIGLGEKRAGRTRVYNLESNMLDAIGAKRSDPSEWYGTAAASSDGDSGGAVFNQKKELVAVLSESSDEHYRFMTRAIVIQDAISAEFFAEAMTKLCRSETH